MNAMACSFACLVEYVEQPLAKAPSGIHAVLSKVTCSRYILQMDLSNTEAEPTAFLTAQTAINSRGAVQAALGPSKQAGIHAGEAKSNADSKASQYSPGLFTPPTTANMPFDSSKGTQQMPHAMNSLAANSNPTGHLEPATATIGIMPSICLSRGQPCCMLSFMLSSMLSTSILWA